MESSPFPLPLPSVILPSKAHSGASHKRPSKPPMDFTLLAAKVKGGGVYLSKGCFEKRAMEWGASRCARAYCIGSPSLKRGNCTPPAPTQSCRYGKHKISAAPSVAAGCACHPPPSQATKDHKTRSALLEVQASSLCSYPMTSALREKLGSKVRPG